MIPLAFKENMNAEQTANPHKLYFAIQKDEKDRNDEKDRKGE
jgi:hypothetical protein